MRVVELFEILVFLWTFSWLQIRFLLSLIDSRHPRKKGFRQASPATSGWRAQVSGSERIWERKWLSLEQYSRVPFSCGSNFLSVTRVEWHRTSVSRNIIFYFVFASNNHSRRSYRLAEQDLAVLARAYDDTWALRTSLIHYKGSYLVIPAWKWNLTEARYVNTPCSTCVSYVHAPEAATVN